MRALQFSIARRHVIDGNINSTLRRKRRTYGLPSRWSVSASRNFHTRSAVLSSLVSTSPSSSSSPSSASLSLNSSSWPTNLLILAGAALVSSSYLSTIDNGHNISRCDTDSNTNTQTKLKSKDDTTVLSSSSPTKTSSEAASPLPSSTEQPIVDDDEEDEETHCTICLINRQGPCRPYWRKFERCMKGQGRASESNSSDENNSNTDNDTSASTMGDKCDEVMMPWITCIQSYRNTYTLISNRFFQDEYVDAVEKGIREEDKICLGANDDNGNASSTLPIDWKQFVEFSNYDWLKDGNVVDKDEETIVTKGEESADANLVEGVARINLWDGDGKVPNGRCRVDLAYVRDQDGLLLGHERFEIKKKETQNDSTQKKETSSNDETDSISEHNGNSDDKSGPEPRIGHCVFHVSPETTKAIQIFALYGKGCDDTATSEDIKEGVVEDVALDTDNKDIIENHGKQTLYYSGLIPLSELKPPKKKPA